MYLFSGGKLKPVANRQYSNLKNSYEITFDVGSEIKPCADDASIKSQTFAFVKISALADMPADAMVDVIAVVKSASEPSAINSPKLQGRELVKRDLSLIDDTGVEIKLTLWGDKAKSTAYSWHEQPIVAFKGLKISEYNGRSLNASGSTGIVVNPEIPEGFSLYQWLTTFRSEDGVICLPSGQSLSSGGAGGGERGVDSLEKRLRVSAIKEAGLGLGDKADYGTFKATVTFIKHDNDPWYTACPKCNKKVSVALLQLDMA